MPFRSKKTLESWLDEFRTTREGGALISVAVQDGTGGADTGLVIVPLRNDGTEIYMQPVALGDPRWSISFGPRSEESQLTPAELHGLAAELLVAASLCDFLQEKSLGHEEDPDEHDDDQEQAEAQDVPG
ncbi:hypothetical protein C4K88_03510 [Arthrobacter pityocampae]|uniref:Protein-L-isoaspartate carboxylmethyltransferase n=1 Tax=Arthrobacter pityocampae TaxID=547334 RepID=A0A2S5J2C0_9MICC|nr:hypothetical protein [Arthrobacter pityocampae]PPB50937.1 hypothetical protein C4K88_03510 [Arthrobacter pityocampae]